MYTNLTDYLETSSPRFGSSAALTTSGELEYCYQGKPAPALGILASIYTFRKNMNLIPRKKLALTTLPLPVTLLYTYNDRLSPVEGDTHESASQWHTCP